MSFPCVHILGAGSIGLLVGWYLRHARIPVSLLVPSNAVQGIRATGNRISMEYAGSRDRDLPMWGMQPELAVGPSYHVEVESSSAPEAQPHWAGDRADGWQGQLGNLVPKPVSSRQPGSAWLPISRLVVTTKAADTAAALLSVRGRLAGGCEILLLQNGLLGLYEEVHSKVSRQGGSASASRTAPMWRLGEEAPSPQRFTTFF
jgi:ketopantoate reductase